MRCPLCNVPMREVDRRGARIDVCPECHGVWLDGGELEKLLEAGEKWESEYRYYPERGRREPDREYRDRDYDRDRGYRDRDDRDRDDHWKRKRRRGFLDEVFDIFDD